MITKYILASHTANIVEIIQIVYEELVSRSRGQL